MDPTRGPRSWSQVDVSSLEDIAARLSKEAAEASVGHVDPGFVGTRHEVRDPLGLVRVDEMLQEISSRAHGSREKEESLLSPSEEQKGNNHSKEDGLVSEKGIESKVIREELLPSSPMFDPVQYLSVVHRNTSLEQLQQGIHVLQDELSERKGQLRALVKDNFERFIGCKGTIDHVHARMKHVGEGPEKLACTAPLKISLNQLNAQSKRIFGPMLDRQDQIQRIKNVLDLLGRFKSLLRLPKQFRELVRKGEHTKVIADYRRARALIERTSMGILHKLLDELRKMVQEMVLKLYERLEDPELSIKEAERLVDQLLELRGIGEDVWAEIEEPKQDPVAYYLDLLHTRITQLFKSCTANYLLKMNALEEERQEQQEAESRWRELHGEDGLGTKGLESAASPSTGQKTPHTKELEEKSLSLSLRLVQRLCTVAAVNIPFFCSLTSVFCSGTSSEQFDCSRQMEGFDAMTLDLFEQFSDSVKSAYNDFIKRTLSVDILSQSIVEFLHATRAMQSTENAAVGKEIMAALRAELFSRFFWYLEKSLIQETEQLAEVGLPDPNQGLNRKSVFVLSTETYGALLPDNLLELEGVIATHLKRIETIAASCGGEEVTAAALWQSFVPILLRCLDLYISAIDAVVRGHGCTEIELSCSICSTHFIRTHTAKLLKTMVHQGHLKDRPELLGDFDAQLDKCLEVARTIEENAIESFIENGSQGLPEAIKLYVSGLESLATVEHAEVVRDEALGLLQQALSFLGSLANLPGSFTDPAMLRFVSKMMSGLLSSVDERCHGTDFPMAQLCIEMNYFLALLGEYTVDDVRHRCAGLLKTSPVPSHQMERLVEESISKTRLVSLCLRGKVRPKDTKVPAF